MTKFERYSHGMITESTLAAAASVSLPARREAVRRTRAAMRTREGFTRANRNAARIASDRLDRALICAAL